MLQNVLVAIDGSRSTPRAVAFPVEIAGKVGRGLRFITITTGTPETASRTHYWDADLFGAGEAQRTGVLAETVLAARGAGLGLVTTATACGRDIAAAPVGHARDHGFGHIVRDSERHSALGRLLAGSVVGEVLDEPHPPVTVV